jgi:mannose/cellobiose epimerase-like protein (N-acyl-D-glucosamine 2-epimerase family)
LRGLLADPEHGGWFAAADRPDDGSKRAYEHAFVILAASTATLAQRPGGGELLHDALNVMERRFWDDARGVVTDVWTRDWSEREPYGGANANMHTVEAFLAAADALDAPLWRERALRIASFFIDTNARTHDWRIPEHFDAEWRELPDYNRDAPAHPFRPYGATIGHGFEWARLCLHLHASLGDVAPAWLVEAARGLFDRAMTDGWNRDGREGFVYTTDWHGTPVVDDHLHWVVCEQIAAAAALLQATGSERYEADYRLGWDHAARHFIDRRLGSWHSQLDRDNRPSSSVWAGKPDTYHAFQATLLPRLPLSTSIAAGVAKGLVARAS